ncbi:MAG: kinase [Alphaproteobacteria bacterium]|nr:kinase [Alphaproteobacteria bacterium]MBU1526466.1 kinase [Alphaproteobacteria bacterium]MBU2116082.1 kinase [Alphaproteobacteria bacterium]MBU2350996.1 kinase [Alphaproteobacteria bacterium]MBU2382528.1 kinase [Alphaproteobacteria bacterium]
MVARVGRLIEAGPVERPARIAIVGAQGSGKTTLARAAAVRFRAAQISIDDVYLTRDERETMAREVHPLFLTRGPPGTHDLGMLSALMDRLSEAGAGDETPLPDFDKRGDDRVPADRWHRFAGRPSAILIDAWCLGAVAEDEAALTAPINALERDRDPDAAWRRAVNGFVGGPYADFTADLDAVLFLRAPGFDVVLDWRCQQEADLLGVAPADLPAAERTRLADFIQYFERVTRRMLAGGVRADVTASLDRNRVPRLLPE